MQTDQCFPALNGFTTTSAVFPCVLQSRVYSIGCGRLCCEARCWGKTPPHTQAPFPGATPHLLWPLAITTPTWASQEWPLLSQSPHLKNLIHAGLKPSPVLVANPKEKHGAGYDSSKGFPLPWQTSASWKAPFLLLSSMPHPWKSSRPGWLEPWTTWCSGCHPCPWQKGCNWMICKVLFNPNHSASPSSPGHSAAQLGIWSVLAFSGLVKPAVCVYSAAGEKHRDKCWQKQAQRNQFL